MILSDEQINLMLISELAMTPHEFARKVEAAVIKKLSKSQQPAQNSQDSIHDPAEIRRVFELDAAEWPEPESGFAKL